jgi:hypothetical protein
MMISNNLSFSSFATHAPPPWIPHGKDRRDQDPTKVKGRHSGCGCADPRGGRSDWTPGHKGKVPERCSETDAVRLATHILIADQPRI